MRRPARATLTLALFFIAVFATRFFFAGFPNDQFDRIGKGRQILVYDEIPFRDFFDPGFFLTLYSSAAMQWVFGHRLVGEALMNCAYIAAGLTLALALANKMSGSWLIALWATLVAAATWPRLYNYDKVLFFPLGLFLCGRYFDRQAPRTLVALGIVTAVASLYRYDNGFYIACGTLAGLASVHWTEPRTLVRRVGLYVAALGLTLAPALLFVHATAGLPEAARQIAEYGQREARRTHVFSRPEFSASSLTPRDVMTSPNAAAAMFYLLIILPPLALGGALRTRNSSLRPLLVSAGILCLTANLLLLRNPIEARIGDVAVAAAPLAAWAITRALSIPSRRWTTAAFVGLGVGATVALATLGSATLAAPAMRGTDKLRKVQDLLESPPGLSLVPAGHLDGPVSYYRECTRPTDRVLIPWFGAEMYYFAGRAFAGGMSVFFGQHWSSEADQQTIVRRLQQQSVPLILIEISDDAEFPAYPIVDAYLRSAYEEVTRSRVEDPEREYYVLKHKEAQTNERWGKSNLPCFR